MSTILQATNIRKTYGTRLNKQEVLKGIDLTVEEGEFVGIMGASGAGKTTLLNVLATIDRPTDGTVVINGQTTSQMKERELSNFRRTELGFIFQDYNLLDTLTVKENILLPVSLGGLSKKEAEARYNQVSKALGIDDLGHKYPHQISGGQKQRTAASRAFIHEPSMIFADEPTGALDSKSAAALLATLERINEESNVTIMMVTHDPMASSYCNRVVFLRDGQLYTELYKGEQTRQQFFQEILNVQAMLGGGTVDTL